MCFQWVVCFIFFSQLYSTCALASQRTCENCESGIFWEPRECEKPNMIWDRCRGHCPITCKGLTSGGDICLYVCLPGCICQQGFYLRKDTNECVKEEDCPTKE
ncbi:hypothetical protein HHI36_002024 [Cryptolaemus montrouzieri]|uniref:TIL domain-containing protein n=1 Tax=Cryptolaemus montrouzieri TaxID=559131 RepID=A0ABD2P983_9CUCU